MNTQHCRDDHSDELNTLVDSLQVFIDHPGIRAVSDAVASADFVTGSGLTAIGRIGAMGKAIALSLIFILAAWVIIGELRAWGAEQSDSFDLITTIIRASALPLVLVIVFTLF